MRILFVEDMPQDAELAERLLRKDGLEFDSIRVDARDPFLEALENFHPDLIISDYSMPSFDGMSALLLAKRHAPLLPFVVLTGSMNEDTAVSCMKAGASDYVIKEHMARLPFAVREALEHGKLQRNAREQEDRLRQSEMRYRMIFAGSSVAMLVIDPDTGAILDVNDAALGFYGWPRERLLGMNITDITSIPEAQLRERLRRILGGEKIQFEARHRRADGTEVDVENHPGPISIGDKTCILAILHDISERKAAELERDQATARLEQYLSDSPTITFSLDLSGKESRLAWISANVRGILGFDPEEALEPDWWFHNVHPQDRSRALQGPIEASKIGKHSQEYRFRRKDKSEVWLSEELRLVQYDQGDPGIVGTLTDINGRKMAEEEIHLKSAALEAAENAVVITDSDGSIEWVNGAFERLTGYGKTEALGRTPGQLLKSGKHGSEYYRSLWETIASGNTWSGEIWNMRKDGGLYLEEMTITPVLDQNLRIGHYIAIKQDVTERHRSKERLEASLEEKETLLREINHRVYNNLQVISSLLSLSGARNPDPSYQADSTAMLRRIQAMALAHEQLYSSLDLSKIDFAAFLRRIVESIVDVEDSRRGKPAVTYSMEPSLLNIETAVPAGIAVSELVSNALRHGLSGLGSGGILRIVMQTLPSGEIDIEVQDNGPGFSDAFDPAREDTLGIRLVDILSTQLHGTVAYKKGKGATAVLRFSPGAGMH